MRNSFLIGKCFLMGNFYILCNSYISQSSSEWKISQIKLIYSVVSSKYHYMVFQWSLWKFLMSWQWTALTGQVQHPCGSDDLFNNLLDSWFVLNLFELNELNGNCYPDVIQAFHSIRSCHKMKNMQICHKNLENMWVCPEHTVSKDGQTLKSMYSPTKYDGIKHWPAKILHEYRLDGNSEKCKSEK